MCYGMGCKYEMAYTGECTLGVYVLDTDEMPKDAECNIEGEEDEV